MKRARRALPLYSVGRMVKTVRFIPGVPVGLCTGAFVEVREISRLGNGIRYRVVSDHDVCYWVDEDAIENLGS